MAREEAKKFIQDTANGMGSMAMEYWSEKTGDKLREALNVLEQEPILDKIRAEIENIAYDWQEIDGEHESRIVVDLTDVLKIIDKYKAESEEK